MKGHPPDRWLQRVKDKFYPMKAIWVASHNPPADPSVMDYRRCIRELRDLGYTDIVAIEERGIRAPLEAPTRESVFSDMQECTKIGTEAFLKCYNGNRPKSKYVREADSTKALPA